MREIAEDILDGSCCALCRCYFKHPKKNKFGDSVGIYVHEYPVACKECWTTDCGYQKCDDVETFYW